MTTDRLDLHAGRSEPQVLSLLRKESLDLYNRLHSIQEDVDFVKEVCAAYSHLPVLREEVFSGTAGK